jgi:RNA polymerase sporulation-specific sigma factor
MVVSTASHPPRLPESGSSSRPAAVRPCRWRSSSGPGVVRPLTRREPRNCSEQLLLGLAQSGDHHAERLLIELHEPLVSEVCRGFFLANGDLGDLHQAARIGVWRAIHGWDPARGVSFRSFVTLLMRREVMMLVSASRTRNQAVLNTACSFDDHWGPKRRSNGFPLVELLAAPKRDAWNPEELAVVREHLQAIIRALSELSEHERGSLSMTLNGMTHAEAAAKVGSRAKSVNNALQRVRRKLATTQR